MVLFVVAGVFVKFAVLGQIKSRPVPLMLQRRQSGQCHGQLAPYCHTHRHRHGLCLSCPWHTCHSQTPDKGLIQELQADLGRTNERQCKSEHEQNSSNPKTDLSNRNLQPRQQGPDEMKHARIFSLSQQAYPVCHPWQGSCRSLSCSPLRCSHRLVRPARACQPYLLRGLLLVSGCMRGPEVRHPRRSTLAESKPDKSKRP